MNAIYFERKQHNIVNIAKFSLVITIDLYDCIFIKLILLNIVSVWYGVIFIRMGSYQDGIFKFIMKIPENFPDGECPVSINFNKSKCEYDPNPKVSSASESFNLLVTDYPLASSETKISIISIHPPSLATSNKKKIFRSV